MACIKISQRSVASGFYQTTMQPASSGPHGTLADCLEACKEGACCEGTTCSVKPQCQCQGTGKTFKGIGTTCGQYALPAGASLSLSLTYTQIDSTGALPGNRPCSEIYEQQTPQLLVCEGAISGTLTFSMTRSGDNAFEGSNVASAGTDSAWSAAAVFSGGCAGDPYVTIGTSFEVPFTNQSAYNLGTAGWMSGGVLENTYYLYNMNDRSYYTTLVTTSDTFPADGTQYSFDENRIPQAITYRYITINAAAGTRWVYLFQAWRVTVRASLTA